MFIPEGFNLYLSDDEILAIPGGYVRPFRKELVVLNVGANSLDSIYVLGSDELAIITGFAAEVDSGTVPTSVRLSISSSIDTVTIASFTAPVLGEMFAVMTNALAIPGDDLIASITAGDATTDMIYRVHGYYWKGLGQ